MAKTYAISKKADLRRKLGLVLQDTYLFSDTVMENIRFGNLDASDEEVIEAAKMADADHFIRQLPNGYQTKAVRAGKQSQPGSEAASFHFTSYFWQIRVS